MSAALALLRDRATTAWPMLKRLLVAAVVIAVIALLFNLGRQLDWLKVLDAARDIDTSTILSASGLVCIGYLVYASFDLLARRYAGHDLPGWKVIGAAAISYALNLNLGVLVGGIGARLRLYHRLGLRRSIAIHVVLFSTVTNWLGYAWLAGILFATGLTPVPEKWEINDSLLQIMGGAMLAIAAGYMVFCGVAKQRVWTVKGHCVKAPSFWMALAQSALAILSWMIMALIVYVLLERAVAYTDVLAILLFCSIAAIIAHIPGGLGVTEAIFVAALSGRLPQGQVLAALLMYRVLYALAPLCLALVAYITFEVRFGRRKPESRR